MVAYTSSSALFTLNKNCPTLSALETISPGAETSYAPSFVAGKPSCVTRGGRIAVGVGVRVLVGVSVLVGVGVMVGVAVLVGVLLGVAVFVGVSLGVGVLLGVGVILGVKVGVGLGLGVLVGVSAAITAPTSTADVGSGVSVNSDVGSKPGPELTCTSVRPKTISTR